MPISHLTKQDLKPGNAVSCHELRDGIFDLIKAEYPDLEKNSYLSLDELNQYRRRYLTSLIVQEKGELAEIDRDVMDAIKNNSILSENIEEKVEDQLTFGQRLADHIAEFGGSWTLSYLFLHLF